MSWVFTPGEIPSLQVRGQEAAFPVHRIYCVGRNYAAHALEMGADDRSDPFFFSKPADAVTQASEVPFPPLTKDLHHEVELVVALRAGGAGLTPAQAESCVFGHAVGVDLTRRDLQAAAKKMGRPWTVAKGFDASAPISELVPTAQHGDLHSRRIELSVNGEIRQAGNTAEMIWPVPALLAELSRYFTLQAGDLVFTGTPAGVSRLVSGDRVNCMVEGLASHEFRLA